MLEERDDTIHGPDRGQGRDKEEAVEVKTKGKEAGADGVKMGSSLGREQTKPALGGNSRFTETAVVTEIVMASEKGNAPREGSLFYFLGLVS